MLRVSELFCDVLCTTVVHSHKYSQLCSCYRSTRSVGLDFVSFHNYSQFVSGLALLCVLSSV